MSMPMRPGRGVGGALGNMKNMDPKKLAMLLAMMKKQGGRPPMPGGGMPPMGGQGMPMPPQGGGMPLMPMRR